MSLSKNRLHWSHAAVVALSLIGTPTIGWSQEPRNLQGEREQAAVSADLQMIYGKTDSATTVSDYSTIYDFCRNVVGDSTRIQEDKIYARNLMSWAANRRGEARSDRAGELVRQQQFAQAEDLDARFIFLWIAFNAAYADERDFQSIPAGERKTFADFFDKLVALDADRRIYGAIWQRFSGPIRMLMQNRFVFNPFWQHHNGIDGYDDWEVRFKASARSFALALQAGDTARVLSLVFDRLYVLRNQLVHGGSTWNSGINRAQVRDGAAILGFLMPVVIDIMMDNPDHSWGQPFYPVVPA